MRHAAVRAAKRKCNQYIKSDTFQSVVKTYLEEIVEQKVGELLAIGIRPSEKEKTGKDFENEFSGLPRREDNDDTNIS